MCWVFFFSVHIWLVTAGNVLFPHFLWTSLKSVCWSIHVCHLVTTSCHVLWTIAWSNHKHQLWFLYEQYHFKSIYNSNLFTWPNYILKITAFSHFLRINELDPWENGTSLWSHGSRIEFQNSGSINLVMLAN